MPSSMPALRRRVSHLSRSVMLLFLVPILAGTLLLQMSVSVADAQSADWLTSTQQVEKSAGQPTGRSGPRRSRVEP